MKKQNILYLLGLKQFPRNTQDPGESILARRRNKLYQLGLKQLTRNQVNPSMQTE
jgi:hypothetical protein